MKKIYLFGLAALTMASCSDDKLAVEQDGLQTKSEGEIAFAMKLPNQTRATGSAAATLLNNKFVVYGEKNTGGEVVFNDYDVVYNTSGSTQADYNQGWYYVGAAAGQTIKYWDYAKDNYVFTAYSVGDLGTGAPTIKRQDAGAGYKVYVDDASKLTKVFFSDKNTVAKANYGNPVTMNFKRLGTKVRVGIYENVPGYAVKDIKFYSDATTKLDAYKLTLISGSGTGEAFTAKGTFSVGYDTNGKVQTTFAKTDIDGAALSSGATEEYHTFGTTMTTTTHPASKTGEVITAADGTTATTGTATKSFLGQSSEAPSWADAASTLAADNYYFDVIPNEAGMGVMTLKADYTLVSMDGSKEVINIKGATAYVPSDYTKWAPNTAYTYLFKITDNSNGTTGSLDPSGNPTDPAGLYPIVFDAVVADVQESTQGTTTTVSTPSITTYQDGSVVTDGIQYHAGDVTVKVMNGATETDGYTVSCYKLAAAFDYSKTLDQNIGSATDILSSGKFAAESGCHYVIKASKLTTDAAYAAPSAYSATATYYTATATATANNGINIVGGKEYTAVAAGTVTEANYNSGTYYVRTTEPAYTMAYKVVDVADLTLTITTDATAKKATVTLSGAADNTLTATNKLTTVVWNDGAADAAAADGSVTYVGGKAVIAYPTTAGTYTLKVTYGGKTASQGSITIS